MRPARGSALEEVQRPAPVALAEAELVRTDVEHRRLRGRSQLVEEEPHRSRERREMASAGASRVSIGSEDAGRVARWSRRSWERRCVLAPADRRREHVERPPSGGRWAAARQLADGRVIVRASCDTAVDRARFMLALDDDTSEFHRRFAHDPLIGPTVQRLRGMRTRRKGNGRPCRRAGDLRAAHPGEESARDRAGDHSSVRGGSADTRRVGAARRLDSRRAVSPRAARRLSRASPGRSTSKGYANATTRTSDSAASGGWAVDGRRRLAAGARPLRRRARGRPRAREAPGLNAEALAEPGETAHLLAPYGEWQGLASVFLLQGFKRGLVPGASMDRARQVRSTARYAA
jgi:hypothetical protein